MNNGTISAFFGALVFAWVTGCGGTVTGSGGDGGGGSGGAGGTDTGSTTTSDTGTTSDSTTSGTGTTGTDVQSLCEQICDVGKAALCYDGPVSECVSGCDQNYQMFPDCTSAFDAAYVCAIDKVPAGGCQLDQLCPTEMAAVQECINGGCGTGTCSGDSTSCSCAQTCNGTDNQVDCVQGANSIDCTCFVNGAEVGACTGSDLSCDLQGSCCSQFF